MPDTFVPLEEAEAKEFLSKRGFCGKCHSGLVDLTGLRWQYFNHPIRYQYQCSRCSHKGEVARSVYTGEFRVCD